MNTLLPQIGRRLADLDSSSAWLVKLTLALAAAWVLHAVLARANPRWRVLLWRGSALSLAILLAITVARQFVPLEIPLALLPPEAGESPSSPLRATEGFAVSQPQVADAAIPRGLFAAPGGFDGALPLATSTDQADTLSDALQSPPERTAADLGPSNKAAAPADGASWSTAAKLRMIWLIGIALGAVAESIAIARFTALRRRARPSDAVIVSQATSLAAAIGCKTTFETLTTDELATPGVVGAWRPAILLPRCEDGAPSANELTAVLAHEIQHLKNRDLAWNAVLRVIDRVLWFHPLAWRVRTAHTAACDAVCDAVAAGLMGDVAAYCRVLARLALRASAPLTAAGLAMARPSSARRRIEALQRKLNAARLPRIRMSLAVLIGLAAIGVLGAAALTPAKGDDADEQPASTEPVLEIEAHQGDVVGLHGRVKSIAFSPDGKRIASGGEDHVVRVWDANDGQELLTLKSHSRPVAAVAFSPDGKWIASGSDDRSVKIWNATTGEERQSLVRHASHIRDLAFSSDGKRIASVAVHDRALIVWNLTTGTVAFSLESSSPWLESVAFSPDGKWLAAGGQDGAVQLWEAATGRKITALKGHKGDVRGLAFSPDGKWLGSGSAGQTIRVWDVATGGEIFQAKVEGMLFGVKFSPDGKRVAAGRSDAKISEWDVATGRETLALPVRAESPFARPAYNYVYSVAYRPDGKRLAAASSDGFVRAWICAADDTRAATKQTPSAAQTAPARDAAKQSAGVAPDETGARVAGAVRDEEGKPIEGAIVQVYSAGVRVGTSPYCPTCYPDCGKRATTDKEGGFQLAGLDPTLLFRLVVLADGYRPEFIKSVDSSLGTKVEAKLIAQEIPSDVSRIVRGVVVDHVGKPIAGALVEPFGCSAGGKRWWGSMPKVDPMAFTDALGRFTIVCDAPVVGLDLKIEARAAARRNFELVASGKEDHRLVLEVGSTVEGRVVRDGRGVPGVLVGIAQTDRSGGVFLGDYQIGTDADGRFSLANLPAAEELTVFGHMNSLRAVGAVKSKKFKSANNATTNLGDLMVTPGYRLQGRVVLSDGKPVPSHTRIMISRPEAWDSTFVEPDAEGRFVANNIPGERISIHAAIPGYRLSEKNKSFEPLSRTSVEGVVRQDIDDLIVLYEPGNVERLDHSDNAKWQLLAKKHNRLKTEPLAGVTDKLEAFPEEKGERAAPQPYKPTEYPRLPKIDIPPPLSETPTTDGPKKKIAGVVIDADGKPVAGARVYLPVKWIGQGKSLTATAKCDDQGQFQLAFPEAWLPQEKIRRLPIVWAYAPGHAIGSVNASAQLFGDKPDEPCTVMLPPESDISFVVIATDGTLLSGAKVVPQHFRTHQGFSIVPEGLAEQITVTTDTEGRVKTPALSREGIYNAVVRFAGAGKQVFRVDMQATTPAERTLKLRPAGRIVGQIVADQVELTRGMTVAVETTDVEDREGLAGATGSAQVQVDEKGRFVIPEIAFGRVVVQATCDERLPVRPRLPAPHQLIFLAGDTLRLEIPLEMAVRVHGVVRAKDTGRPIAGAAISVRYGGWRQGSQGTTDEHGVYSTFALAGDAYVQVISQPRGYVQLGELSNDQIAIPKGVNEFELPAIEMAPTTTVSGTLLGDDGKPVPKARIHGVQGNRRYGFGETDADGKFSLSDVPAGITLEKFGVFVGDDHFTGVVESNGPLVVRPKP